ncbi:Acetyl-CoA hydrolase [Archaeoglobus sulfaticallidus PM70-1]|uniref:Acetyl-CoA hydrolase n=1 Tax=Archaeoglobus sulfaticallidus PM70-1 TaxID=387631 RepID=N0BN17_9EURY|nr:acetyl-CoA hydrolase/transferase C-terminal domain-containing protein [Archaeoglobus sulfaticallidus]AGK61996.1 Acetyl-CoA hydrolase [Archaeoglobus sulfaticallidus PM70-1]
MYKDEYDKKLISAEEAAGLVEDGMWIELGGAVNTALIIDKYLAKRKDEFTEVKVGTFIDISSYEMLRVDPDREIFKWTSGFLLAPVRECSRNLGVCVFKPNLYHDVPRIAREVFKDKIDIVFLPVTPMDKNGYFNFGLTCSHLKALAESAKKVVLIVKEDMPWIYGGYDEIIHISEADYIVEDKEFPTPFLPFTMPPNEEDKMIAENIFEAGLLEDGMTVQVGIGGMPDSVVKIMKESGVKDLGIHTEMMGDGILELINEGIVTNNNKKLDKGKSVFTFTMGTKNLYEYLDRNPSVATYPVDYTNDPFIISQQPKMFSINGAAQIDLMGQVNSEQMGLRTPTCKLFQVSGTGGQLDFVMGCLFSRDRKGKSILGLYSTYKGDSRILPVLDKGAAVTVPRSMTQYVVTEWGVAYLRGYSVKERALALIRLAHPDHRDWLVEEARKVGIFPPNYNPPAGKPENVLFARD